jgi:hypothetical protein
MAHNLCHSKKQAVGLIGYFILTLLVSLGFVFQSVFGLGFGGFGLY